MMTPEFQKWLEHAESLIRDGQGHRLAELFRKVVFAKVPRNERLMMADICRRGGLIQSGLRLLSFVVNPDSTEGPATAKEIAGYAALLHKNSSLQEALKLLATVDTAKAPEALLYQAFCHFSKWDYAASLPILQAYRESCSTPYARLVANVNLAAALIAVDRWEEALLQIENNLIDAGTLNAQRLAGNSLEMRAQCHLHARDYAKAIEDLEHATQRLGTEITSDQLFILKWRAIVDAAIAEDPRPIIKFRGQAVERRHFESVREADYYLLKTKFDEKLFFHLYFGTPFASYRGKILEAAPSGQSVPEAFSLGSPSAKQSLNLHSGDSDGVFTPGDKIHQILAFLWRDFYQPTRLGALFAELFPDEHFNPWTSPNRIHQLLRRTRRELENHRLPVTISEVKGGYRVDAEPSLRLTVSRDHLSLDRDHSSLIQLKTALGDKHFSAKEASAILQKSGATVTRLLKRGIENGEVKKFGSGPSSRYLLAG